MKYFLATSFLVLGFLLAPFQAHALLDFQVPVQPTTPFPFGGFIYASLPCTCTPGLNLIYVSPPVGGLFTYWTGSQQYLSFNLPSPGHWVLGEYIPGGPQCLVGASPFCYALPSQGLITGQVGTSP